MGLLREPRKTTEFENRHSPDVASAISTPCTVAYSQLLDAPVGAPFYT